MDSIKISKIIIEGLEVQRKANDTTSANLESFFGLQTVFNFGVIGILAWLVLR